jgi:hypothetical protein
VGFLSLVTGRDLDASLEVQADELELLRGLGTARLVRAMELIGASVVAMRDSPDPRITLEVAFLRLSRPEDEVSLEALTERLERLERSVDTSLSSTHALAPSVQHSPPVAVRPGPPTATAATPGPGRGDPLPDDTDERGAPNVEEPATRPALGAFLRTSPPASEPAPTPAVPAVARDDASELALEVLPAPARPHAVIDPAVLSIDAIRSAWEQSILGGLRLKVRAIFQAGRFVEIDAGVAVLAVPNEAHLLHADPLRPELETALSSHFGKPVAVRLISETTGRDQAERSPSPSSNDQPAAPARSAGSSRAASAPDDPEELEASDEDFADIASPIDVDDRTSAASTGVDWARERVLKAFPGAEEV